MPSLVDFVRDIVGGRAEVEIERRAREAEARERADAVVRSKRKVEDRKPEPDRQVAREEVDRVEDDRPTWSENLEELAKGTQHAGEIGLLEKYVAIALIAVGGVNLLMPIVFFATTGGPGINKADLSVWQHTESVTRDSSSATANSLSATSPQCC